MSYPSLLALDGNTEGPGTHVQRAGGNALRLISSGFSLASAYEACCTFLKPQEINCSAF